MTNVLSQDEIDQLLTAINAGDTEPEDFRPASNSRKIKIYDFKRPDKFSKEQIRTISILHESYARELTSILSSYFRMNIHIHVASIDQLTYEEFIHSIPTPTMLPVVNADPLSGNIILEIDPAITGCMINRIFGGEGVYSSKTHELTALEKIALEEILHESVSALAKAWANIVPLKPKVLQVETNPQFAQIVPPTEMTVLVTMEMKFGETEGMMNICFPFLTLEPVIPELSAMTWFGRMNRRNGKKAERICIEDVPVLIKAELFSRVCTMGDIMGWKKKTILYPHEGMDLGKCRIKIGNAITFIAQPITDKNGVYSRRIRINELVKPYEERFMENKSEQIGEFDAPGIAGALRDVNIQLSVELGRTRRMVKEILTMGEGSIVELDKLAGEPVDILANNVVVAKGEVVVIDENFGVRITELINAQRSET